MKHLNNFFPVAIEFIFLMPSVKSCLPCPLPPNLSPFPWKPGAKVCRDLRCPRTHLRAKRFILSKFADSRHNRRWIRFPDQLRFPSLLDEMIVRTFVRKGHFPRKWIRIFAQYQRSNKVLLLDPHDWKDEDYLWFRRYFLLGWSKKEMGTT